MNSIAGRGWQQRVVLTQLISIALALSPEPLRAEKIRILPAGDSNTLGVGNPMTTDRSMVVGYRKKLKELLAAQGIEIDYVGKVRSGYRVFDDPENEGYPGQGSRGSHPVSAAGCLRSSLRTSCCC
jgi:hypothetical protein